MVGVAVAGRPGAVVVTPLTAAMVRPPEQPLPAPDGGPLQVTVGIVLRTGATLSGPGVTAPDALAATVGVLGALAVHDGDRVTAVVLGRRMPPPSGLDLGLVGVLLERDGVQLATAAGAASFGHPAAAAAAAADSLAAEGGRIEPGWLVFCGGLTPAVAVASGSHVRAVFGHLGAVTLRVA